MWKEILNKLETISSQEGKSQVELISEVMDAVREAKETKPSQTAGLDVLCRINLKKIAQRFPPPPPLPASWEDQSESLLRMSTHTGVW